MPASRSLPRLDLFSVVGACVLASVIVANLVMGWWQAGSDGRPFDVAGAILAAVVGLSFAFRHTAPGVGLVLAMAGAATYAFADYPAHPGQAMIFVSLYYFARSAPEHALAVAASTFMVVAVVVAIVIRLEDATIQRLGFLSLFALPVLPVLIARTLHANDAKRSELERRLAATRAAQTAEAERLLAEQRLAIARDLHDTVAHSVATVSVQSGAALAVFDDDPEAARGALLAIRESSKAVIAETKSVLATLRDVPAAGAPTIEATAAAARDSGLRVTVSDTVGGGVTASTGHAVNRTVQESVANILRHSTADRVDIDLRETEEGLTLVVADNGAGAVSSPLPGNGLRGMAERAALLEGVFAAGAGAAGGFEVRVDLPLHQSAK